MSMTIPVLPCAALPETLAFYRALGFEVTHQQTERLAGAHRPAGAPQIRPAQAASTSRMAERLGAKK
jgi:catechol 2,3-dioxygenase-like lactoylglutathione lyase family enzyme